MRATIWLGGVSLLVGAACLPAATAQEAEDLGARALSILERNCHSCHGKDGVVEGGLGAITDRDRLVDSEYVRPSKPDDSLLLSHVEGTTKPAMPPKRYRGAPFDGPRPTKEEIALLREWIEKGAEPPRSFVPARREFLRDEDVLDRIAADLAKQDPRSRGFLRYFTITHLWNAGVPGDELELNRQGLSKLLNSLSWERQIVRPQPIEETATILRVDLRNYSWTRETWDLIAARNPYAVRYTTAGATSSYEMTGCSSGTSLPAMRADWFVAAASRPPLYHEILGLPASDKALEAKLGVDVLKNLREEARVLRAGIQKSGVSSSNRVIERHVSSYGAYWKSYDFADDRDSLRHSVFARPLGPEPLAPAHIAFDPNGGEIIFNLPNGLQAYLIINQKGERIDDIGPPLVVDPRRDDKRVTNGISCMTCHAQGMRDHPTPAQLRATVLENEQAYTRAEHDKLLALYADEPTIRAAWNEDSDRFARAVADCGAKLGEAEQIATLSERFDDDLDLKLAAAELGLLPAELDGAIRASEQAGRILGILRTPGGRVQRQAFVADAFAALVGARTGRTYMPPGPRRSDPANEGTLDLSGLEPGTRCTLDTGESVTDGISLPAGEYGLWFERGDDFVPQKLVVRIERGRASRPVVRLHSKRDLEVSEKLGGVAQDSCLAIADFRFRYDLLETSLHELRVAFTRLDDSDAAAGDRMKEQGDSEFMVGKLSEADRLFRSASSSYRNFKAKAADHLSKLEQRLEHRSLGERTQERLAEHIEKCWQKLDEIK